MNSTVNAAADLKLLARVGNNYILTIAGLLTTAVLYGVYLVLFFAVMTILCRRDGIMSARMVLLGAVVVLFILSSVYITTSFAYTAIGFKKLLVEDAGTVPLTDKNKAYIAKYHKLGVIGQVIFPVSCVIGDAIVVWRAWALSGGNKKLMAVPVLCLLGLTASCFSYVGCMAAAGLPTPKPPTCLKRNEVTFIFSMITNVAGTAVMGYTVWSYRRAVKKYLQHCRHQVRAEKILVMLLESGVIYTTLWIMQLAVFVAPAKPTALDQNFRYIFSNAAAQLVGIYPTLMIVLVFLRRSLWDPAGKSTICDNTPGLENTRSHGMESNSSHSIHEHDLMRSKQEPEALDVVFYQDKHDDGSDSGRSPISPS